MADKRPFAKIDTGYILNPKWHQVRVAMQRAMPNALHDALQDALRAAMQAHLASILYCAQNMTDGQFPVPTIKSLCQLHTDMDEAAITALFEVGLWVNRPGGMAEVRDYLEHQTPAADIQARSDAARKAAAARWGDNAERNAQGNAKRNAQGNAGRNAEEKRREEKLIGEQFGAWYAHYPKKVGRGDALKAFKAAIKKTDLETLTAATKRYAKSVQGSEAKFIKNPGPWLRDERWLDDLTAASKPAYDPWVEERVS